jgi:hypothetical protein
MVGVNDFIADVETVATNHEETPMSAGQREETTANSLFQLGTKGNFEGHFTGLGKGKTNPSNRNY